MIKKILSRRGFTIVEVLVAFVIFSIMAAMIAMILNTTMRTRQGNIDLENEIAEQKEKYYLNTQDMEYSGKTKAGDIQLSFTDGTKQDIPYAIGNPNADTDDNKIELDYYIGKVNYNSLYQNNTSDDNNGVGSVMERLDSRIYGTSGIEDIYIKAKYLGEVEDGYRYEFDVLPVSSTLAGAQYEFYAQFKLKFQDKKIIDYGYIHHISKQPINKSEGYNYNFNLATPTKDVLCIGSRMSKDTSIFSDTDTDYKKLWVTLDSTIDVGNLNAMFGTSGTEQTTTKTGESDGFVQYHFTPYIEKVKAGQEGAHDDPGTIKHVNIFGAFPKEVLSTDEATGEATDEATSEA